MEFISLIALVLSGKKVDKSLPNGKAVTFDLTESDKEYTMGSFVKGLFPENNLYMLLCLQTLSMEERKVGGIPSFNEIITITKAISKQEKKALPTKGPHYLKAHAMGIGIEQRCDVWERIEMLEQLIVEIVRANVPSETEHRGVRYRVNSKGAVRRVAISEPQFLKGVIIPA